MLTYCRLHAGAKAAIEPGIFFDISGRAKQPTMMRFMTRANRTPIKTTGPQAGGSILVPDFYTYIQLGLWPAPVAQGLVANRLGI